MFILSFIQPFIMLSLPICFLILDILISKKNMTNLNIFRTILAYFISFSAIVSLPGLIGLPFMPFIMMGFASDSGTQPTYVYALIFIIGYLFVGLVFYVLVRALKVTIIEIKKWRKSSSN